jgi:transposase InsO family protein
MTQDDVLFGYRLSLFDLADHTTVANACRTFGVHRSTYYRWKAQVDRHGLEMLRPRERRRSMMPNQLPVLLEERIVGFSLGHPGMGPRRISAQVARPQWGGLVVSPNGVSKVLRRHGISTRARRLALIAGYRAPYDPPREPEPEPHIDVERPGELIGVACFYVGRLHGTKGTVWQLTAIDVYSSFAWAELIRCPDGNPSQAQTSRLQRVVRDLKAAGWKLERVLSDNGSEFQRPLFSDTLEALGAHHSRIHAGRPQTNGHVERLHRTILEECWRPAFARYLYLRYRGLKRELDTYIHYYNHERAHTGRLTKGAIPAELVYGARKMTPQ